MHKFNNASGQGTAAAVGAGTAAAVGARGDMSMSIGGGETATGASGDSIQVVADMMITGNYDKFDYVPHADAMAMVCENVGGGGGGGGGVVGLHVNNGIGDGDGRSASGSAGDLELSDIFYTSQKKGHVFQVKLNTKGFTLQRESLSGATKEQLVNMCDIVGSRCMRLQKIRRLGGVCACSSLSSSSSMQAMGANRDRDRIKNGRRASASAALSVRQSQSNKSPTIGSIQQQQGTQFNEHALASHAYADDADIETDTNANGNTNANDDDEDDEDQDEGDVSAYLYVFAYVLKKNIRSALRRERTVLTLRFRSFDTFEENMLEADRWYRALRWHKNCALLDNTPLSPVTHAMRGYAQRRLLILLNPKSGSGKARELFHQHVAPVLNEAEVPYDLFVTKHARYAHEFVRVRSMSMWSGVVAVGGDGLFHEILNGLLARSDWDTLLRRITLGIIPCGSGNGLARSIAHEYDEPYDPKPILGAALTVISGKAAPIDVVRIELRTQVIHSSLSVGWGLISDIDIESERLRSLGYQRFTVWTLHRVINLRSYRGRVSYLPKLDIGSSELSTPYRQEDAKPLSLRHSHSYNTYLNRPEYAKYLQSNECASDVVDFNDVISLETSVNQSLRSRCDSWFSMGSRKSTYYSVAESVYHSVADESDLVDGVHASTLSQYSPMNGMAITDGVPAAARSGHHGPRSLTFNLDDPLPDSWIIEDDEFIMVHAAYQTHLGIDCYFAPSAKLNDGIIYLVMIRSGISRSQLLSFLINMSSGTHLPTKCNEFVKVVPVTAFRIEPHATDGIITVDGERVEFGALQAEMLPSLARVMVPK